MSEEKPDPEDLTSPGTINDPELERERAKEALERELESRAEPDTKFDQLRREQEAETDRVAEELEG